MTTEADWYIYDRRCGREDKHTKKVISYDMISGMWLTIDVVIDDINWYEVRLMLMMILIWNDVIIDDYVNMSWCCYWWLC